MDWIYLVVAGLFEMAWALGLKYSQGFTRLWASVGTVAAMIVSVALLALAMRSIGVGTAYAVWTGIGVVGAVVGGIFLFDEPWSAARLGFIALILIGIIGLKFTAGN